MKRFVSAVYLLSTPPIFAADPNPRRVEIEKAIWSRQATQMRIEWPDGKRQVVDIFDCFNDRYDLGSYPLENARRIWVRNFNPADCAVMGILQPSFFRQAKPELVWREVWKAS
jgi:hypothetical protein